MKQESVQQVLKISEIFYSIQGEGRRAGTANVFIRTQGCKAKFACFKMGIKCDTEFESGTEMSIDDLYEKIKKFKCKNIIWTGGEPAQQLTKEIIEFFSDEGYYQAIETSGLLPVPEGLNYVVVSPKVAEHVVSRNFPEGVDELRYVRHSGQSIPEPSISATSMFVSPHSDGFDLNSENLNHCIKLVKDHPQWSLSIQMHKLFNVL